MLLDRAMVDRVVVDAMVKRGLSHRKGADLDTLLGDYTEALGMVPEVSLRAAALDVLRDWTYTTWPNPGHFRKACERYFSFANENAPKPSKDEDAARIKRSAEAHAYARHRMHANNYDLLAKASKMGPWAKTEIERFLFDSACKELREGRSAHVSNADLDQFIRTIEEEAAERSRQLAEVASGPQRSKRKVSPPPNPMMEER